MKRKTWGLAVGAALLILLCALTPAMLPRPRVLRVSFPCDAEWRIPYWEQKRTFGIAVRAFQEVCPDWEVRVEAGVREADYSEWLMEQFLQGTEPDVFLISQADFALLQERGALKDLTQRIDDDPAVSAELFFDALWQAGRVDGRSYALPFLCNPQLMAVNDDLLEQKRIAPVADDWTWSELHQKCRLIDSSRRAGRPIYGLGDYTWEMAAYANGSLLFNRDGSDNDIHETSAIEAVNYVYHLGGLVHSTASFEAGNVAFAPIWAIECRRYTDFPTAALKYSGFRWHCAPMPRGPLGRNASQTRLQSVAVSSHTRCPDAAFEFLKILATCPQVQDSLWETTSAVPALRSSLRSLPEGAALSRDTLAAVLEQAVVPFRFSWYEETMVQLNAMIQDCFQQREKLEISLRRVHQDIIDYRARMRP